MNDSPEAKAPSGADERTNNTATSTAGRPSPQAQAPARGRSWRDVLDIHPAAELFPLMSPDELRVLGENIKKHGLVFLVTLSQEMPPRLVDGRNRLDALELIGDEVVSDGKLDCRLANYLNRGADPWTFAIAANIHRRHLTAEQRRELIAKLIKAAPEKSSRQIAKMVGASTTTATKVREDLVERGDVSRMDTSIVDTKGRQQPAKKKRRINPRLAAKPDPTSAIKNCLFAVKVAVERALVTKRGDAEHQALVFESVRRCLAEMEQARPGGAAP